MGVPHPIPYQGSKRWIAKAIVSCFPPETDCLIEPFAGSAAVTLAAAYWKKARRFVLGDVNAPLMELWAQIINRPEYLSEEYAGLWRHQKGKERAFYDQVRNEFNRSHKPACLLYLLARCVKAAVRYNTEGEFNNSPDNRRKGARPDTMRARIVAASALLRGRASLHTGDYRPLIAAARSSDIVYMDPPYQGVCGNRDSRYLGGVVFEEFAAALADLNARGVPYIVSYDGRTGSREYGRRLPGSLDLTHIEIDAGRSTQATLLGRSARTYESLYLSPVLLERISSVPETLRARLRRQELLFQT